MRWRVILSNLSFVAVCRRPEVISTLRHPNAVTDGVSRGLNPDSVADLDRDALAEAATWFLSLGWLDRPMFESTWTSLLAACTPPSGEDGLGEEENPFANSKEVGLYHHGHRISPFFSLSGTRGTESLPCTRDQRTHPSTPQCRSSTQSWGSTLQLP